MLAHTCISPPGTSPHIAAAAPPQFPTPSHLPRPLRARCRPRLLRLPFLAHLPTRRAPPLPLRRCATPAAAPPRRGGPVPALRFLRRRVSLRREPLPLAAALLLAFSVERTLLPKLLFLRGATGLPDPAVCAVLRRAPAILSYGIETNLTPKLQFLSERMGRDPAAELAEFPHYFAFSLEGRIRPRHEALRERGVEMSLKDMLTSNDDEFRERLLDATLSPTKARL